MSLKWSITKRFAVSISQPQKNRKRIKQFYEAGAFKSLPAKITMKNI